MPSFRGVLVVLQLLASLRVLGPWMTMDDPVAQPVDSTDLQLCTPCDVVIPQPARVNVINVMQCVRDR